MSTAAFSVLRSFKTSYKMFIVNHKNQVAENVQHERLEDTSKSATLSFDCTSHAQWSRLLHGKKAVAPRRLNWIALSIRVDSSNSFLLF